MSKPHNALIVVASDSAPHSTDSLATHGFCLADALARDEHCVVSMLVSGHVSHQDKRGWRELLSDTAIEVFFLGELEGLSWPIHGTAPIVHRSYEILEFVKLGGYDIVYFYDRDANGLVSVQAKQCGAALSGVPIVTIMHSPGCRDRTRGRGGESPVERSMRLWAERYVCERTDLLAVSGSGLSGWTTSLDWRLPQERAVLAPPRIRSVQTTVKPVGSRRVIYYGEPGGLETSSVFVDAIEQLLAAGTACLEEVVILCELGTDHDLCGLDRAWAVAEKHDRFHIRLIQGTGPDALRTCYEEAPAPVVVALEPDTSLYRLLDCIELGLPFLCVTGEDVSEYAAAGSIAGLDPARIARGIRSLCDGASEVVHPYSGEVANEAWRRFHDRAVAGSSAPGPATDRTPSVCVCVAHYNHGDHLAGALKSLAASDYSNFEVVVVDDGSTDRTSLDVFRELERRYPHWTFLRTENRGPGAARNYAVNQSKAELVMFLDADNQAIPSMISKLVHALDATGSDCVTCYFKAFQGDGELTSETPPVYQSSLLGAALEPGLLENVFGDTSMLVKRDVFKQLGGFSEAVRVYEDWEFLAALCLRGYDLAVLPEPVFWYRHSEQSRSRGIDRAQRREALQRIARVYQTEDYDFGNIVHDFLTPIYVDLMICMEDDRNPRQRRWEDALEALAKTANAGGDADALIRRIDRLLARERTPFTVEQVFADVGMEVSATVSSSVEHASELLQLDGRPFVIQAYRTLLLRDPEPEGLSNYSQMLSRGLATKLELLQQIRNSPEGRLKDVSLPGLYRPDDAPSGGSGGGRR